MNNSFLAVEKVSLSQDTKVDRAPILRQREGELITILDSLKAIQASKEWSSLKNLIFDELAKSLSKELRSEARADNPNVLKLRFIAGQIKWAEKYADLKKLEDTYRLELTNVRIQLYGKTQENHG
jgi:hypothetical protein